jgi:hypothetical protein
VLSTATPMAHFIMPHPGQKTILAAHHRFKVVACGRRFGKTLTGQIKIMELALKGATTWWLAPTYSMAEATWRDLKQALATTATISEVARRIDLPTGGSIAIRSTHHPDSLRGAGLDYAVLDEAAFMEPTVWPAVVRPMLLERNGGALFLSTPFGRNWFWETYKLGLDPEEPDWASFQFTSADNPLVPASELDTIRRTTPDRVFREEYLAQFIADAGQVFRGLDSAFSPPPETGPNPAHRYVAGVDWGKEQDYTAIAILNATTGQMVALDRFQGVGWSLQRGRLAALCAVWRPAVIWAEANSIGSPNIEALQADGLTVRPFMTTRRSKPGLIEGLALALERGELALLDDPILQHELVSYTLERLPGGGYRYSAPPGGHDDTVIATALAWYGVRYGGPRLDFV